MEKDSLKDNCAKNFLSRRKFINLTTAAGLYGLMPKGAEGASLPVSHDFLPMDNHGDNDDTNIIGAYGKWAAQKMDGRLPSLSFRRNEFRDIEKWRDEARKRTFERLAMPDLGGSPGVKINRTYNFDGLHIEELSWELPYGRPVEAILLKPAGARKPLPGILAFHEHGGKKYFGKRKITRTSESIHPHIQISQQNYYEGIALANEIARRGYVVLVHDAFPFASRRVMLQDVPSHLRQGLSDHDPENPENIDAYNRWAVRHESIMAKSLFSAGTTWPGVWLAEDMKALDILCARDDVDAARIGCGGLSGGGMRTVFIGGLDDRIKCAVCVGLMTTWKDFMLNKSHTHTWMKFVPLLPNELDFPEILGLSVPSPVLVINAEQDGLFTLPGMKQADDILKAVYKKAKAPERYKGSFYPGGHQFTRDMQAEAFAWFDRWLK